MFGSSWIFCIGKSKKKPQHTDESPIRNYIHKASPTVSHVLVNVSSSHSAPLGADRKI